MGSDARPAPAPHLGDQYLFVAIDAETKRILHFDVGKPNMVTAYRFMNVWQRRLTGRFQLGHRWLRALHRSREPAGDASDGRGVTGGYGTLAELL